MCHISLQNMMSASTFYDAAEKCINYSKSKLVLKLNFVRYFIGTVYFPLNSLNGPVHTGQLCFGWGEVKTS